MTQNAGIFVSVAAGCCKFFGTEVRPKGCRLPVGVNPTPGVVGMTG